MTYLKVQLNKSQPAIIKFIAGSLKKGRILVLPTDTIYGLSGLATEPRVLKRIYKLKKRDARKPLIVLMSDLKMLKKYAVVSGAQAGELRKIWGKNRRPTTVILKNKGKLPKELVSPSGGLAVRLPKSLFLIKILRALGRPLISTSVNLAGQEPLRNPKKIKLYFLSAGKQPDLVVDAGYCRRTKASRLLDLRNERSTLVLRK